jgi:trans-2,3-dihydro-3-hydroxyanthranilate isomerase
MTEDPATGSATAAASALLAELCGQPETHLRIRQGVDMGRPSLLLAGTRRQDGATVTFVGGGCVEMFDGSFVLASADA